METTYEVKIESWDLDEDSENWLMKYTDIREFDDRDKAYKCARFWTEAFNISIHEGTKLQYRIEVTHIERNTYRYSSGAYRCR